MVSPTFSIHSDSKWKSLLLTITTDKDAHDYIEPNFPTSIPTAALGLPTDIDLRNTLLSRTASSPSAATNTAPTSIYPPTRHSPLSSSSSLSLAEQIERARKASEGLNLAPGRGTPHVRHLAAAQAALAQNERAAGVMKQMTRRWAPGDMYAPHDLSSVEQVKWSRRQPGRKDVLDAIGWGGPGREKGRRLGGGDALLGARGEWKNVSVLEEFRTPMGRIRPRKETGLRVVNQRKVAKAIRRAIGMAWLPSVHRHPEVLENLERKRNERRFGIDGRSGYLKQ